ncbi:MAG: class I SAM-dependent methyltransferase [Chloroflexi bacterium]|nr:class I SAM-dependent methyltransferase [Chloroflexota bacterium]
MIEFRRAPGHLRTWYNQIYTDRGIRQMDSFFLWVLEVLDARQGERLLDVSCGEGQLIQLARARSINAMGVDISDAAVKIAAQHARGAGVMVGSAEEIPLADSSFDLITNIGSLEHYESMATGAKEMARVLRPGGRAAIYVPNTFGLRWNVMHAWRTGDVADDGFQPLQRYGSRVFWTNLLMGAGLQVAQTLGYEHETARPRTWQDVKLYLNRPKQIRTALLIAPWIPVNMASNFLFLCRRV